MPNQPPPIPQVPGSRPAPPVPPAPAVGYAGPAMPPAATEPSGAAVVQLSFWQQPFVQDILPFIASLALHLGLLLLGLATVKVVQTVATVVQEQIIIPDSGIVEGAVEGGIPHPGLGGDPTRDAAQDRYKDVPPDRQGWAEKPGKNLEMTLMGGGSGDAEGQSIIGSGGALGGPGRGVGIGRGDGVGSGTGDGSGPLAPFGIPGGGGGIGPRSKVFGPPGGARRVAYVCDASGSMMSKFDDLRVEIHKAIDNLKPTQQFNVIFFQAEKAEAADPNNLLMANPDSKRRASEFLERVVASGQTNPIPALEIAFRQRPELIYLLTDGEFPDNDAVLRFIKERNADKRIKINTIAFVNRGEEYERILKNIAQENGGLFKYVGEEDLGH